MFYNLWYTTPQIYVKYDGFNMKKQDVTDELYHISIHINWIT